MQVPFLDIVAQDKPLKNEILKVIDQAIDKADFIGGPNVSGFEKDFASFCEVGYCVAVGSGTDALRFALMVAGVGPGHDVITVAHTFIATTEAISQVGARPVFVDIDPRTWNIDVTRIESAITDRTRAIVPVHLYGQPADMEPIKTIAAKHDLMVIEDACQAHGARYQSEMAGSIGDLACFSFYPGKNLGAYGEAGAVTTHSRQMAEQIAKIRDHGQRVKYHHDLEGFNGRMDAIQAGILQVKLKKLAHWNDARRHYAKQYSELLNCKNGLTLPTELPTCRSVYHLYVITVDNRDALQAYLAEKGIATGLHYPVPLHLQKAYRHLGYQKGDFPVTEKVAAGLISLPMHPVLEPEQIQYVTDCINEFYR